MRKLVIAMGMVALAMVLTTTFAANRGVQFTPLGIPEGAPGYFALSMNADGTMVAGSAGGFGALGGCVTWDATNGFTTLSYVSGACYMSRDGMSFTADQADAMGFIHAARWDGTDFVLIPDAPGAGPCDATVNTGYNISGDGSTIVGLAYEGGCGQTQAHGFYSTEAGGTDYLMQLNTSRPARANAANWDGTVIGGWNDNLFRQGVIWRNGVPEWVYDTAADSTRGAGEVYALNRDGSAAGGLSFFDRNDPTQARRGSGWVLNATGLHGTGMLPGAGFLDSGATFAISEDGSIGGGRFGFGPFSSATIWTETTGLINLNQFLIDQGRTEPFDGWLMVQVNAISDDGTKLLVFGANPDSAIAANESVIIDISKVSVCHAVPTSARTLTVSWDGAMDHVAHGDFLGTCEAAGIGARAATPFEFFGVDPSLNRFQDAVNAYTETYDPRSPVAPGTMNRLIEAGQPDDASNRVQFRMGRSGR